MLWYSACAVGTALQTDALGLNLWRLLTGIGLGVGLVTIDGYLSELVPPRIRGRAFALNQVITYSAVPAVALLSSILVPQTFMGMEGWRLVMVSGATGALAVWVIRLGLPESPRWLATHGRIERANAIVEWLEQRVAREDRGRLEAPVLHPVSLVNGSFGELWSSKYRMRTIMLLLFHAAQSVGLYGFSSWVPTFLIHQGVELAHSLQYTLIIAFMTPVGPVLAMGFADRFERKFQIVAAAILVGATGLAFSQVRAAPAIVLCGSLVTLGATVISLNFHAYQSELYPTRIRALAVGFVYLASRISGMFSGFLISFALLHGGVPAALALVAGCVGLVALSVGLPGSKTRGQSLEVICGDDDHAQAPEGPAALPTLLPAQSK